MTRKLYSPKNTKQLVDLGITAKDWSSWCHLGKYAPDGPYINWCRVSWRAKQHFRCSVPERYYLKLHILKCKIKMGNDTLHKSVESVFNLSSKAWGLEVGISFVTCGQCNMQPSLLTTTLINVTMVQKHSNITGRVLCMLLLTKHRH